MGLGIECVGGPNDGAREDRSPGDEGDVHSINGYVYVTRWWYVYDEDGMSCGAEKKFVAPGVRVPCTLRRP